MQPKNLLAPYSKCVAFIFPLLVIFFIYQLYNGCSKSRYIKDLTAQSTLDHNRFKIWKDSIGRQHAQISVTPEYLPTLQPVAREKVDKVAKSLKVKSDDIGSITEVKGVTKGTIETSTKGDSFNYSDGYLGLKGYLGKDTLSALYSYTDTATYVHYTKRKKFLGVTYKKDDLIDFHFNNPSTTIIGVTSISLKQYSKPKHFGLGLNAGVTYYNGSIRPYLGVGVNYSIITW